MPHLSKQQLDSLKQQLHTERQDLLTQLEHNDHYGLMDPIREITGDSSIDNHPADHGTEVFERAKDIALNEHTERTIDRIDRALSQMQNGKYGVCDECGKDIPFERLEVLPYTQYCVEHSPNQFVSYNRPIEESIEVRPFGRTSLDEHEDTQFDGEDAWQIVEQWGTSNTPAFAEDNHVDNYDEMFIESGEPDGYVEPVESFLATDLYGHVSVIRNSTYQWYMATEQGDRTLEYGTEDEDIADI